MLNKINNYLDQLKKVGINCFLFYNINNLFFIIIYFPFVLIFILIRLVSPIFLIRFGFYHDSNRLGHFGNDFQILIKEKINSKRKSVDFIGLKNGICNKELINIFSDHLVFIPNFICEIFYLLNKIKILNSDINFIKFYEPSSRDYTKLPQYKFYLKNIEKGDLFLKNNFNIDPENSKIACIFGRDSRYLKKIEPNKDFSYHSYRDVEIENLKKTSEHLANLGYTVFRMGQFVEKKISFSSERIIDYGFDCHSDYMDVYLAKKAKFWIGCPSGAETISFEIFKKPAFFYSWVPLADVNMFRKDILTIFKKFFSYELNRYLTTSEIFDLKLSFIWKQELFDEKKVKVVENSEDEIFDGLLEFIYLYDNEFKVEDKKNSIIFKNLLIEKIKNRILIKDKDYLNPHTIHGLNKRIQFEHKNGYIGNKFLDENNFFLT